MTSSFSRLVAVAVLAATAMMTSLGSSAHAGEFDYLNHMNPAYRACVSNVEGQITPGQLTGKVQDSIITACNKNHPAFPSQQSARAPQGINGVANSIQNRGRTAETNMQRILGHRI